MKYIICERVNHYHEVEIDDELNIDTIINVAMEQKDRFDTGYENIESLLVLLEAMYGFKYTIKPNSCGTETVGFEVSEEIE